MTKRSKIISRILAAIILVCFLVLLLFTLSKVFASFKGATNVVNIYKKVSSEFDHHHPYFKWLPDGENIVGKINPFLRSDISKAYLRSWASANLSIRDQKDLGLAEHYTDEMRSKITQYFDGDYDNVIESIDLNHELELHFISFDKQVVSFTDRNVRTIQRIKNEVQTPIQEEVFNYNVVMTLDDGKWRINKMVRAAEVDTSFYKERRVFDFNATDIRGINYYPQKYPWRKFWAAFPKDTIVSDFKLIDSLGFNTIRFFIPFNEFGGPHISEENLLKLDFLFSAAKAQGLKVMPTLFDFPVGFELLKYTGYDRHLKIILERYRDEEAIVAWDIKNEPDIDFNYHKKEDVLAWLDFMIKQARRYDDNHPITIGWAHIENGAYLSESVDFVSFHYYEAFEELDKRYEVLKSAVGAKDILVSEYGMTSYDGFLPGGHSETEQSEYIAALNGYMLEKEMGGMLWSLYDFDEAPSNIFGWKPWVKATQKQFGIINADGSQKPSAQQIKNFFRNN